MIVRWKAFEIQDDLDGKRRVLHILVYLDIIEKSGKIRIRIDPVGIDQDPARLAVKPRRSRSRMASAMVM